jgi:hypothetical protein
VRWRKTLEILQQQGLAPAMIALSVGRLDRARQALEHATARLEATPWSMKANAPHCISARFKASRKN